MLRSRSVCAVSCFGSPQRWSRASVASIAAARSASPIPSQSSAGDSRTDCALPDSVQTTALRPSPASYSFATYGNSANAPMRIQVGPPEWSRRAIRSWCRVRRGPAARRATSNQAEGFRGDVRWRGRARLLIPHQRGRRDQGQPEGVASQSCREARTRCRIPELPWSPEPTESSAMR